MGGMLLHLQRHPATPLLAAERCTNDTEVLEALRVRARTAPSDTRPALLRWLFPLNLDERSPKDFTTLEDSLAWADVEELCIAAVGEAFYRQLQQGTEPFGAMLERDMCLQGCMTTGSRTNHGTIEKIR